MGLRGSVLKAHLKVPALRSVASRGNLSGAPPSFLREEGGSSARGRWAVRVRGDGRQGQAREQLPCEGCSRGAGQCLWAQLDVLPEPVLGLRGVLASSSWFVVT